MQFLSEYLRYEPDTGKVFWIKKPARKIKVGQEAGSPNTDGYMQVGLMGERHYVHRIAFHLMGEDMPELVDHINRDPTDNRWCNLRPSNKSLNGINRGATRNSKSGVKGVYWWDARGKYMARFRGKTLGYYRTLEEAETVYESHASEWYTAHEVVGERVKRLT
jgi:hypothetical protein